MFRVLDNTISTREFQHYFSGPVSEDVTIGLTDPQLIGLTDPQLRTMLNNK